MLVKGERREQSGLNETWEVVVIPVGSKARRTGEESRLPASRKGAESKCSIGATGRLKVAEEQGLGLRDMSDTLHL